MNDFPVELFELILNECDIDDLFRFGLVSKRFMHITKNIKYHKLIKPKSCNNLMYILDNYKFNRFGLCGLKITDESVKLFGACHTLDLSYTNITDVSVKLLGACHTLYIFGTKITDESVKLLSKCHTLYLSGTNITDENVKFLGACHTLDLSGT